MAIGGFIKRSEAEELENYGYFSDESDFYGDEATKVSLSQQAASFDVSEHWRNYQPSLTSIGNTNVLARSLAPSKEVTTYNPYEGHLAGRQLTETVNEFLQRLPPATTLRSDLVPWIYISNPFRKVPDSLSFRGSNVKQKESHPVESIIQEAPPDDESDWAQFVVQGGRLLQALRGSRVEFEKQNKRKAKATVTKALNAERDKTVKRILELATEVKCTSGKWLIFAPTIEVDAVWSIVAKATAAGDLGTAAKVAPDEGEDRRPRVICVYTEDFANLPDIDRVVRKLKDLGLVETNGRPIHYKCDAYTYLEIGSSNEYNIKASMYSSADFLKAKDQKRKNKEEISGFFKKQK